MEVVYEFIGFIVLFAALTVAAMVIGAVTAFAYIALTALGLGVHVSYGLAAIAGVATILTLVSLLPGKA